MKNKVYIFTLVKNEQRYINEWIEHNLNIGIDKIIIFEDIGSNSHYSNVCNYNNVILYNIKDIFNKEEKELYNKHKCIRQIACFVCFNRLFCKQCDWSSCIDVDEYIECNNINEIIKNNESYAQIAIYQKVYTYNNYIKDPYPNEIYSIRNTYTKYNYSVWGHKSLFNMHNQLIINNFNNPICVPHRIIDFDAKECIKSNYEIGHYITKSWEEYVYDQEVRGRMDWWTRDNYRFFLKANELTEDELINKLQQYNLSININKKINDSEL